MMGNSRDNQATDWEIESLYRSDIGVCKPCQRSAISRPGRLSGRDLICVSSTCAADGDGSARSEDNCQSPTRSSPTAMSSSIVQTTSYYGLPDKQQLLKEFQGRPLKTLRTPSIVIDRHLFANNCSRMHEKAAQWGAGFRAHVKTHKVSLVMILS